MLSFLIRLGILPCCRENAITALLARVIMYAIGTIWSLAIPLHVAKMFKQEKPLILGILGSVTEIADYAAGLIVSLTYAIHDTCPVIILIIVGLVYLLLVGVKRAS